MPKPASKPAPKAAQKPAAKPVPKTRAVSPALEDYLEAILNLSRDSGSARSRDISESLSVHKSTVTAALKTLAGMKLVNYSPYEAVTLTPEGKRIGEDVAGRHRALQDFFVNVLRVDPATAAAAACGMEHSVPREIVEKLADFAASMDGCPRLEPAGKVAADRAKAKGDACGECRKGTAKGRKTPKAPAKRAANGNAAATDDDLLEACYSRR